MTFVRLLIRWILALIASVVVMALPLSWFRFCQTAPDSIVVEVLCEDGTQMVLSSSELGGEDISLGDSWVGDVTLTDNSGNAATLGRHLFGHVPMGRLHPETCIFRLTAGSSAPSRVYLRRIGFKRRGFFSASVSAQDLPKRYRVESADIRPTKDGLQILLEGSDAVFRPADGFSLRWAFIPEFRHWTSHDKISLLMILGMAFGCSLLAVFPHFRPKEKPFSRRVMLSMALVSLCAAFFFGIVLPLSSYLANRNGFAFSTGVLLGQQIPRFLSVFTLCFLGCLASYPFLGWIPTLLLQGFLFYEYLETGILSADFPSLAGSVDFFLKASRQIGDLTILAAILGVFVLAGKWIRPWLHWFFLGLMVMLAASLADTRVADSSGDAVKRDPCVQPGGTVLDNAVFSGRKNVLFFVLDAIDVKVADEVLQANPEWLESLTGFTAFTNNVGMYSHTSSGVPGILTGQYAPVPKMTAAYGASAIGTNAFFRPYAEAGYPVFTLQSGLGCGWSNVTNSPGGGSAEARGQAKRHDDVLHERMDAQMAWNVEELCLFRALPFFEKAKCLGRFRSLWEHGMALTPPEGVLFAALRKAPVSPDIACTLHFHHSKGGHIPFIRDRNGRAWNGPDNLSGYLDQSWYALGETVRFLEDLKARGLYDNSLIVLLADHGLTYEHFRDVERNTHPFLWVKSPHSNAPFTRSGEPTSHSKVHLLARESLDRDLTAEDVKRLLLQPEGRVSYTLERRVHYDPHFYDAEGRPVAQKP